MKYLGLSEGEFDLLLFDLRNQIARRRRGEPTDGHFLTKLQKLLYDYKVQEEMKHDGR